MHFLCSFFSIVVWWLSCTPQVQSLEPEGIFFVLSFEETGFLVAWTRQPSLVSHYYYYVCVLLFMCTCFDCLHPEHLLDIDRCAARIRTRCVQLPSEIDLFGAPFGLGNSWHLQQSFHMRFYQDIQAASPTCPSLIDVEWRQASLSSAVHSSVVEL